MTNAEAFMEVKPVGKGWDLLWMPLLFGVVYGLLSWWPLAGLHPTVWEDVAIAGGLRPPGDPFPGLYRIIVSGLFQSFSPDTVLKVLMQLGRVCVGLSAVCVYLVFRDTLPTALRLRAHVSKVGLRLGRVIAFLAAILFACAEPVWRAGLTFSPVSLFILMASVAGCLFFLFLRRGSIGALYLCFALLGFISAETTLGFLLLILAMVGVLVAVNWSRRPDMPLVNPLVDDLMRAVVFKRLTYAWLSCFVAGVTLNVVQFVMTKGLDATGHVGVLGLLFEYVRGAWESTCQAATGPGWLFALLFCLAPFIFVLNILPKAWDDDKFLPWSVGMCSGVAGVVAVSQLAGAQVLWFWTWLGTAREMVPCDILLAFMLIFNVATVAFVLAIFGVDACCRNYRRIAQQQFPESMLSEGPAQMAESLGRARAWRQRTFALVVLAIPLLVVPGRIQPVTRGASKAIQSCVEETIAETKSCKTMFTDGSFDALVELEALRQGRSLVCLSLMAPNKPREKMLRLRASENDEDRALFVNDAATALRTWVENDSPRLTNAAVQIGFEMWKRVKKSQPPFSGLVALPGGVDKEEVARALAVCRTIGDEAEALAQKGKNEENEPAAVEQLTDAALRRKFPFVLWRLSRLAQMRSQVADLSGDRQGAIREAAMADMLDKANASVQKMKRDVNWLKMQSGGQLTPREGLIIGLSRGDFAFAGRFAAPVLAADPDDPRANFAMGMMYFQEEKYSKAETHLLRCLVKRPDEPAVLNNLAIVETRLGKFPEAEKHIAKAIEKYPTIPELKKTRENLEKAKADAEAAAMPKVASPAPSEAGKKPQKQNTKVEK